MQYEVLEHVAHLVVTLPDAQHHPRLKLLMLGIAVEPYARGVGVVILVGVEQLQLDEAEPRVAVLLLFVFGAQLDAGRLARLDVHLAAVPCLVLQLEFEPVPALFELELLEQVLTVRDLILVIDFVTEL